MDNPYAHIQYGNPGQMFVDAFQKGQQQRRESDTRNALMKYAAQPDDPGVWKELASSNPEMAIKLRQQQQEMHLKQLDGYKDQIAVGASILQQVNPHDQASWDHAKQIYAANGGDASQLPVAWDDQAQQYVQGVIAANNHLNPPKGETPPNIQREVEYYRSIGHEDLAQNLLVNHANPQIGVNNNDGTYTLIRPPVMAGQNLGAPAPQGVTFTPINGGPTPQASGGFPGTAGEWKY